MDNPDTSETINNKDTWQGSTKTHDGDQQRHMTGSTKTHDGDQQRHMTGINKDTWRGQQSKDNT